MLSFLSKFIQTTVLKNRGYGGRDTPKDDRDYDRGHFFGNKKGREVPPQFNHGDEFPEGFNQLISMACTYFKAIRLIQWKFWNLTGKKLKLNDELIFKLWDKGTELGYGHKKRGAYIYDPLKFLKKYPQVFKTEDGETVVIWVKDYFVVKDDDMWEEVYYGGGVCTGTSSRIGLDVQGARFRPFFPRDKKQNKGDGHAFPIMGKGYSWPMLVNRAQKIVHDIKAAIHPNSWGKDWGDEGTFYTRSDQRDNLFRFWGFTIGYEFDNELVVTDEDEKDPEKDQDLVPDSVKEKYIFRDVGEGSWAAEEIKWAVDNGLMKGYGDESLPAIKKIFQPDKPVSRAELVVVLKRFNDLNK